MIAAGLTGRAAMAETPRRQRVFDEHLLHRLQIELGGQIHDREIFVVELVMLVGRVAVALDQMPEEIAMRIDMPVEIHRHEAGELQESRIDLAHAARMRERHLAR